MALRKILYEQKAKFLVMFISLKCRYLNTIKTLVNVAIHITNFPAISSYLKNVLQWHALLVKITQA